MQAPFFWAHRGSSHLTFTLRQLRNLTSYFIEIIHWAPAFHRFSEYEAPVSFSLSTAYLLSLHKALIKITCMYEHMLAKIACIVKDLATYFTLVLFLPWCMFSHVTIIWPWTNVRFSTYLTCVFWLAIICNEKKIHYWNSLSIIWTLEERRQ